MIAINKFNLLVMSLRSIEYVPCHLTLTDPFVRSHTCRKLYTISNDTTTRMKPVIRLLYTDQCQQLMFLYLLVNTQHVHFHLLGRLSTHAQCLCTLQWHHCVRPLTIQCHSLSSWCKISPLTLLWLCYGFFTKIYGILEHFSKISEKHINFP